MGAVDLSRYIWPDVEQGRQPQIGPLEVNRDNPLTRGIFVALDGRQFDANAPGAAVTTGSTRPPLGITKQGIGSNLTGATYDIRRQVDGPLANNAPWTFAVTHQPTAYVDLSFLFGFGLSFNAGTIATSGANWFRSCLLYQSNYQYYDGTNLWNTGVPFDVDGAIHTALFATDGTSIYFYRDGVLRGSTAYPLGGATPTGYYAVLGNRHPSGTLSASTIVLVGTAWNKALSDAEARFVSSSQVQLFASPSFPAWVPGSSVPVLSAASMYGITSSGGYPRVTRS